VARRVSPVERIRAEIDQLFSSDHDLASILEEVARLSVRLVLQAALEAEVEEFLGRARYERRGDGDRPGSRNGHQPPMTVKTTMGAVQLQRPKLRGTDQAFCSRLFGAGVTRTNALESLVISGWVRGLSDRDIEATLAEVLGPEAALSRSTVSRICAAIGEEFAAWRTRDLSGVRLDYLFLDASHLQDAPRRAGRAGLGRLGHRCRRQAGVCRPGAGGVGVNRRLGRLPGRPGRPWPGCPAAGVSDGAAGLIGAFDRAFPRSLRQRCLVHRARNVLAKVSVHDQPQVKAGFWAIFDVGEAEPGDQAVAVARQQAAAFAAKWRSRYPSAVACVTDDLASLTVHLRFPAEHWHRIRHSNLIERTFGETRRRTR
jgi:putative transposase